MGRRGAEPLHYAADANHWDPAAQAETIAYLLSAGADPHAVDRQESDLRLLVHERLRGLGVFT